ncbi:uncharacterized protein LOC119408303 [Nematolebias whitei]|uniref:uncharacterized protein LOC119408303 n=1 Tax=Nematolebias whitei TaxID=451745 RepID=UPI001897B6C5|nr:uncharacterized protein LOC119408303 [Nematolebias whitei]
MVRMEMELGNEEEGEPEGWTTVGRGRGRGRGGMKLGEGKGVRDNQGSKRDLEGSSSEEERVVRRKVGNEEFKVILKLKSEDGQEKISPIGVSKEIKKKIGDVEMVKILRDGSLLIECKDIEQKNKAFNVDNICKRVVLEKKMLGENIKTRGVIYGIPLDEDLEKLKKNIVGAKVTNMKRLSRTVDGKRVGSQSILMEFEGKELPMSIKIGYISFQVRPYVPPPLRCYKCQRYGHIAAVCKGKQRCPKCGEDHKFEECKEDVEEKCCNCGGKHRVTFGGCEVRKRAKEVVQIKTTKNISYAEAVKSVKEQEKRGVEQTGNQTKQQTKVIPEDKVIYSLENLVLFIAYVINCTVQAKNKTEKIKIIVKGAEKFLGFKEGPIHILSSPKTNSSILPSTCFIGTLTWDIENAIRLAQASEPGSGPQGRRFISKSVIGNTVILTIIDRFSKSAHFVPLPKLPTALETAQLMVTHVFRLHGIPLDILSDRGPQIISQVYPTFHVSQIKPVGVSSLNPPTDPPTTRPAG